MHPDDWSKPHRAWVRTFGRRWIDKGKYCDRWHAEKFLATYLADRVHISGVALPEGIRPETRRCSEGDRT